jgi:adenine-specific DNA-methyltransferase
MKVRDNQNFLSLYFEPGSVETAVGTTDPHAEAVSWKRETRSLGQVATPEAVARLMARWVTSRMPGSILDPAAGLGSLLHECHRLAPRAKLVGVERDRETLLQARNTAPDGAKLVLADYLLSEPVQFQGIIANPPYVKAHRLEYPEGTWRTFEERFGTPLDRLTNLYALFLLKIWQDLAVGGRAAVLLPAEFLNANFGEEIKERLLKEIRPPGLVVFAPTLNLFEGALTTSAILFLEKGRPVSNRMLAVRGDSLEGAAAFIDYILGDTVGSPPAQYLSLSDFSPSEKWLNTFFNGTAVGMPAAFPKTVGDYFGCRRGIATGANDFFCLSESGMKEHRLSARHVEPCLTKATDAAGLVFSPEKLAALAASDRRCYLLNPRENGPALQKYLQIGEELGIPKRHLPSHRPVWYLPENRAVADIWVAVFSRETVKFILNTSGAKNLTCFHGLYAKPGHGNLSPLMTLFLNSGWGREAFSKVNRYYGDGLNKLEPKDVEALGCPEFPSQSAGDCERLRGDLLRLEGLPADERQQEIDALTGGLLGLGDR